MKFAKLIGRNLRRKPLRVTITVASVAISLMAYLLLRTVNAGWTRRIDDTPEDRVVTRHKVGWEQTMPVSHAEQIRSLPGVKHAMGGRAIRMGNPREPQVIFEVTAVEPGPFIEMHYELVALPAQKQTFLADRQGALVSKELATQFGWKLGDRIRLRGPLLTRDCELTVDGIYESTRHGFAQRAVWLHWEYLNELVQPQEQDRISVVSAQVIDKSQGAEMAMAIDRYFQQREVQTFSQEDQATNASFVGMFGAIMRALDIVGILILGIILLLVGNTMSMTTRERSHEFGVLRAIGFSSAHAAAFVLAEAALIGLMGGIVGIALSYPLLQTVVSRYFEDRMRLAPLEVPTGAALTAVALGGVLGLLSAGLPAWGIAKLKVTDALRRV